MACALMVGACGGTPDTVASSYGDYNPAHPPSVLPLQGQIRATDPSMIREGGTYWVFSSGPGILVSTSTDLVTLQSAAPVFAQMPPWVAKAVPDATELWSPYVVRFGGTLHLYYAASTFASKRSCIGHATAPSAAGPFVDQGKVVCSNVETTGENWNAIDPAILVDGQEPWMVFGSYDEGIKLIALDQTGARRDTAMVTVATRPGSTAIQAPSLYRYRDYYYLFVAFDGGTSHSLRVGRSPHLSGPYLDRDGTSMLEGGGTLVLAGDDQMKGPGSNMIFDDGERRLNLYHAYDVAQNNVAVLRIAEIFFDNAGWPVTAGP